MPRLWGSMTTRKKNLSQLKLPVPDATVELDQVISSAFAQDLIHPTKSRPGIADELSALLGRTITAHQLDNWAAPSHPSHRPPLDVCVALLKVTGQMDTLKQALRSVGALPIAGKDIKYLALAKKQRQLRNLEREIQDLETQLK